MDTLQFNLISPFCINNLRRNTCNTDIGLLKASTNNCICSNYNIRCDFNIAIDFDARANINIVSNLR